jgi:membrane peptidoglycan carboxypeptidase
LIVAEGKQRRDGLGRSQPSRPLPGPFWLRALTAPFRLVAAAFRLPFERLRPRPKVEVLAPLTDDEIFLARLEILNSQARTLTYLLQTCIARFDLMIWPKKRVPPLEQPRTIPAASLRIMRRRLHPPRPMISRRAIPPVVALTLVAPAVIAGAAYAGWEFYGSYVEEIVPPRELAINQPLRGARIYDREGRLLYEYVDDKEGMRYPVALDEVSEVFLAATIATEDASFFTNPGVNPRGLMRAAWENFSPFLEKEDVLEGSGGSSITQQLVKNVYIPFEERMERSMDRKLREALYAIELTQRFSKEQILEWYVNQISYGGLYNGIEAASQGYFGKPAKDLTLAEAALLAGIPQSPAKYSPVTSPETAQVRRDEILDLIAKQDRIQVGPDRFYMPSLSEIEAAKREPLAVLQPSYKIEAPHFVLNHVMPQLEALFGRDAVYQDGLVVTTTLDLDLQYEAQGALERWISEFEGISNSHNGAVIVLDNHSGEILALLGSRDYFRDDLQGNIDNLSALNSPGSSFKPFVYLASFLKLGWTPSTIIDDSPVSFRESDGTIFTPQNPVKNQYLGPITLRNALGNSLNVPAFKAALRLGVPQIIDVAKTMGFTTLDGQYGPAISIGGVDLTAMDLAYGYSVLANNGKMVGQETVLEREADERQMEPIILLRVEDAQGNMLFDARDRRVEKQVVPAEHAYMVTSILSDPGAQCVTFGCGGVSIPGRMAAVKTGTSAPFDPNGANRDKIGETWAFGYTPDYSVGVWAGNSDNAPIANIFSTSISFRVMRDTLQAAHGGQPSAAFTKPDGIEERRVCSGENSCRTDVFIRSTSSRQQAQAEENRPQENQQPQSEQTQPDTRITAASAPTQPAVASVTGPDTLQAGAASVQGWAWSNTMQFYRLEYGFGPSPTVWSSLGQWSTPVQGGTLGVLPPGLPAGTYSLRVVVQDQRDGTIVSPSLTVSIRP